jgi:hypothetical protein
LVSWGQKLGNTARIWEKRFNTLEATILSKYPENWLKKLFWGFQDGIQIWVICGQEIGNTAQIWKKTLLTLYCSDSNILEIC